MKKFDRKLHALKQRHAAYLRNIEKIKTEQVIAAMDNIWVVPKSVRLLERKAESLRIRIEHAERYH